MCLHGVVFQLTAEAFQARLLFWTFFFRDYVRSELDSGYEGPIYLEPLSMNRFSTALIGILLHISVMQALASGFYLHSLFSVSLNKANAN